MILVEIAQRAKLNESVCGDVVAVTRKPSGVFVAVADGLGHGEMAHQAARVFCDFASRNAEHGLVSILGDATTVMAKTRGAAAALVNISHDEKVLEFAGIGNIELRALSKEKICPISVPGIVGSTLRRVRSFRYNLNDNDLIAVFSDGISSRFDLAEYLGLNEKELAQRILRDFGKAHDDATCVVLRREDCRSLSSGSSNL